MRDSSYISFPLGKNNSHPMQMHLVLEEEDEGFD